MRPPTKPPSGTGIFPKYSSGVQVPQARPWGWAMAQNTQNAAPCWILHITNPQGSSTSSSIENQLPWAPLQQSWQPAPSASSLGTHRENPELRNRRLKAVLSHQDRNWNNQPSGKMYMEELTAGYPGCLWEQAKPAEEDTHPAQHKQCHCSRNEPLSWNSVPGQDWQLSDICNWSHKSQLPCH